MFGPKETGTSRRLWKVIVHQAIGSRPTAGEFLLESHQRAELWLLQICKGPSTLGITF